MDMKRLLAVASCVSAFAVVGAGSAFAGEIRGPGSPTGVPAQGPDTAALAHTNSICAASGLNEFHVDLNGNPLPGELPIRTQSYGQLVAAGLKDEFPSPGDACNGSTNGLKG
jgi:hypothetical protein